MKVLLRFIQNQIYFQEKLAHFESILAFVYKIGLIIEKTFLKSFTENIITTNFLMKNAENDDRIGMW